jgi:hypothetical protein
VAALHALVPTVKVPCNTGALVHSLWPGDTFAVTTTMIHPNIRSVVVVFGSP